VETNFIKARKSNLFLYQSVPLYSKPNDQRYAVYKPAGMTLKEMRVEADLVPHELFLKKTDKTQAMRDVQKAFNKELKRNIQTNSLRNVKQKLVRVVQEMFSDPTSGVLEGLSQTVSTIVGEYTQQPEVIKNFWLVSDKDYTTALHSINVMALAIRYAVSRKFSVAETKVLGLSALLHDVGKTRTDLDILLAPRKLSDEEFAKIKGHTIQGYNILRHCKFSNPEIKLCALQHHEKLDGTGYPNGLRDISKLAQIVGLIDCFEALTNDERPYRDAMVPFNALDLIQKEVNSGKFSKDIFEKFVYSLS
jgi:putative nucleotidyltransferase with HDIG domain